ncbi:hypothetical protein H7U19_15400 [Hyunsoonleella sp. SJ7]|uniref:Uncharacterized protein n=1 Tax=Hyunsoonleella aquatilis TaxID=2762758 RepID=A0A923HAX1_9FLAO|nr:DUF6090 family protein [Hyunsoonleella aquatilis]MBC3759798.1 hypothetical protein [Hyunsoonleella aquatilis]
MIKFFRKIRQKLLSENKFSKYLLYAIGEIVLVVIGILIALQVNNWNQNRLQEKKLSQTLKVLASNIESDINALKLLKFARERAGLQADSIAKFYFAEKDGVAVYNLKKISQEQANFFSLSFKEVIATIQHEPDLSVIESLKRSENFSNLQATDIIKMINAYYAVNKNLQRTELKHNDNINELYQEWDKTFRNNYANLFSNPWSFSNASFEELYPNYERIANNQLSKNLYYPNAKFEADKIIKLYDALIQLGDGIVNMVSNNQRYFDAVTKANFENRNAIPTNPAVLSMLVDGKLISGFNYDYASSAPITNNVTSENGYASFHYPDNTLDWFATLINIDALNGRISYLDFSKYSTLTLEMKGETGGETFEVTMKDIIDPPDGSEKRALVTLTDQWQTYTFNLNEFETADKSMIQVPLAIVFQGPKGMTIHVKTIKFR